jgi:secreted PhoX family phosphatase
VRARMLAVPAAALSILLAGAVAAYAGQDDKPESNTPAVRAFGVVAGLDESSTQDIDAATATANPLALATLAKGLSARVVTSGVAAPNLDMMALWPAEDPQYLLACNEQGVTAPGVQRIDLRTGAAVTIVTGTTSCDPLHVTPWGTVIFGEETTTGHIYELIDPVSVQNATLDRVTGLASTDKIVRRDALGAVAFEGIGLLSSGAAYYGDELAPQNGTPGGAYYKFIPTHPWSGGSAITSLADSPLAAGTVYALKVGQGSNTGQGMAQGIGAWVPVAADPTTGSLRPAAVAAHATGFYRPEDLDFDGKAMTGGTVRFCGNDTGREEAHFYGETVCITDGTLTAAAAGTSIPEVQLFVVGSPEYNMPDNIGYQPGRGNWIVHEDGETTFERPHNNDLWSCLPDGGDADLLSDGCLRIGSLNDLTAEWTGGFFSPDGDHFYVSIQHNKTGHGVVLDITGWR